MSSMPETERGYAPPIVRQFSVFLDNRVGKLLELLEVMETAAEVSVRAICVLDSSDHAVVRVVCGNADGARFALRQRGFTFSETDILVFEVPDESTLREASRSVDSSGTSNTRMSVSEKVKPRCRRAKRAPSALPHTTRTTA